MFKVISKSSICLVDTYESIHYTNRTDRVSAYKDYLSSVMLDCFIVNTNHKNGLEIHCINEYGLIYIYNKDRGKLITILNPRPRQLKRYYTQLNLNVPQYIKKVMQLAYGRNEKDNLNEL